VLVSGAKCTAPIVLVAVSPRLPAAVKTFAAKHPAVAATTVATRLADATISVKRLVDATTFVAALDVARASWSRAHCLAAV
jgi:hypothetical protein